MAQREVFLARHFKRERHGLSSRQVLHQDNRVGPNAEQTQEVSLAVPEGASRVTWVVHYERLQFVAEFGDSQEEKVEGSIEVASGTAHLNEASD